MVGSTVTRCQVRGFGGHSATSHDASDKARVSQGAAPEQMVVTRDQTSGSVLESGKFSPPKKVIGTTTKNHGQTVKSSHTTRKTMFFP